MSVQITSDEYWAAVDEALGANPEIPEGARTVKQKAAEWGVTTTAAHNRLNRAVEMELLNTAKRGNVCYFWPKKREQKNGTGRNRAR